MVHEADDLFTPCASTNIIHTGRSGVRCGSEYGYCCLSWDDFLGQLDPGSGVLQGDDSAHAYASLWSLLAAFSTARLFHDHTRRMAAILLPQDARLLHILNLNTRLFTPRMIHCFFCFQLTPRCATLSLLQMDSKYGECGKNKSSSAGSTHAGDEVKTKCMVHSGFYDDWLSVRDDVLVSVKKVGIFQSMCAFHASTFYLCISQPSTAPPLQTHTVTRRFSKTTQPQLLGSQVTPWEELWQHSRLSRFP